MSTAIKNAVMALFPPTDADISAEPDLPVAPDASIEIVICPHCDQNNCEVWNSTEARMATCADCGTEFSPPVFESAAKRAVVAITERRLNLRRRAISSDISSSNQVKAELDRLLRR